MRDRHFITWLVGLIATPIVLTMFPQSFALAVPMVLGAAALLGMIVMMVTGQFERSEEDRSMHHVRRIPVRAQRLLSHLR